VETKKVNKVILLNEVFFNLIGINSKKLAHFQEKVLLQ